MKPRIMIMMGALGGAVLLSAMGMFSAGQGDDTKGDGASLRIAQTDEESDDQASEQANEQGSDQAENLDDAGSKAEYEAGKEGAGDVPSHLADRALGADDAPVTLIEYANFTCIHCDRFHSDVFPALKEKYIDSGKVRLIYREIIGDGPGALATSLARCVDERQYFNMVTALYETDDAWLRSQKELGGVVAELTKLGVLAGLPKDKIQACFDDRGMQTEMLERVNKLAEADKVRGTPSFILNGKMVDEWSEEKLFAAIDKALGE